MRETCSICSNPTKAKLVNLLLSEGASYAAIEARSRAENLGIKRETVSKHHRFCVLLTGTDNERSVESGALAAKAMATGDKADFARLVRDEAVRALNEGRLRVTTNDGLVAQAMLDKREERRQDRQLALRLAVIVAGSDNPPPKALIVEGEFEELPAEVTA